MFKILREMSGRVGWEEKLGLFLLATSTLQLKFVLQF